MQATSLSATNSERTAARWPSNRPNSGQSWLPTASGGTACPSDLLRPDSTSPATAPGEAVEAVILRAMARDPNDRFPSALALGRALLPFATQETRTRLQNRFDPSDHEDTVPLMQVAAPNPRELPSAPTSTLDASSLEIPIALSTRRPRANRPVLIVGGIAILVIYLVLGVLYESFIHPITILSGLPSAGLGALITLLLFKDGKVAATQVGALVQKSRLEDWIKKSTTA